MGYSKYIPYTKGYKRYKQRKRFKRFGARLGGAAHTAYKAYQLAMKLKDQVNVEYKFLPNNQSQLYDYNGTLYTLNSIPQGDTDGSRDGDSCKIQNLTIRGNMQKDSGVFATMVRVMVFWDKQNKIDTVAKLLENPASIYAPLSPKQYDNRFQTKVLYDQSFNLDSNNNQRIFEKVIPVNLHTQFSAASTTINTGALKMLIISDQVTTNLPTVRWLSKTTFTDN